MKRLPLIRRMRKIKKKLICSCEASTLPLSYTPKYLAFQLGREGNRTLDISQQRNLNVNFRYNLSIMDGIAPYSRFVRIEQQRLADMREELGRVREDIFALQAKIKGEL